MGPAPAHSPGAQPRAQHLLPPEFLKGPFGVSLLQKQPVNSATQNWAATKRRAGKGLGPPTPPRQHGGPYLRPSPPGASNLETVSVARTGQVAKGWNPGAAEPGWIGGRLPTGLLHQLLGVRGCPWGIGRRLPGSCRLSPEIF